MSDYETGQEFRDTYREKISGKKNSRHIRLLSKEPDGRWLVETFHVGDNPTSKAGRKTRVSEQSLRSGYAPRQPTHSDVA